MFGLFESKIKSDEPVVAPSTTRFVRASENPIISPDPNLPWKARATYNPAAVVLNNKVHLVYRAQGNNGVSVFGYAASSNGFTIDESIDEPIYTPTADFEMSTKDGWNSGCEDPRITIIDNRLILTYTAYDGTSPPRVAITSISINDFLDKKWNWESPKLISPPGVDDKDACIVKSKGNYYGFHRLGNVIWIDKLKNLEFPSIKFLTGGILAQARPDSWDNIKVGIAAPPIETDNGWLLLYHAACNPGFKYKIGAMLLDYVDPHKIIARTSEPLLEPEADYEKVGQVPDMVFSCGAVVIDNVIFMYYGGADSVVCVATMKLSDLVGVLTVN